MIRHGLSPPLSCTILSTFYNPARHPDRYRVYALTAHTSKEALLAQCREHRPRFAVLDDANDAEWLQQALAPTGIDTKVLSGPEALCDVASVPEVDTVMAAIVGAAGLLPALAAAEAGKRVLLANKEALVMSGALFMEAVERFDFYEAAKSAHAVVRTGESRPYGCFIFKKGVIFGLGASKHLVTFDDGRTEKLLLRRHGNGRHAR